MVQEVQMPKLGQTMEEGTIETWLKKEGEKVEKGEPLFEVTTDKATLEVEAFASGTLLKVLAGEGETREVNEVIAYIGQEGEEIPEGAPAKPSGAEKEAKAEEKPEAKEEKPAEKPAKEPARAEKKEAPAPAAVKEKPAEAEPGRIKASPRAKKLSESEKVPLSIIRGSGPSGRIIEEDVERYLQEIRDVTVTPVARELAYQNSVDLRGLKGSGANGKVTKEDVESAGAAVAEKPSVAAGKLELTAMRKIIADRMTESKTTVPHYYVTMDVDMGNVMAVRKKVNSQEGVKISFNDIIMKACADAYKEVPRMNANWGDDHIVVNEHADIALAVSIEDGLMVPVVRSVDQKDYLEINEASQDLIARARSKKLGPDDYEGGALTISNLGMYGVDNVIPIINPGQAGILGIGKIQEKVVVIDGGIHIRPISTMTLCCDHRVVDGAEGAEYLAAVKNILENLSAEE